MVHDLHVAFCSTKETLFRVMGAVRANLYLASLVIEDDKSRHEKDDAVHRLDGATPVSKTSPVVNCPGIRIL